jgi:hypothetical protein
MDSVGRICSQLEKHSIADRIVKVSSQGIIKNNMAAKHKGWHNPYNGGVYITQRISISLIVRRKTGKWLIAYKSLVFIVHGSTRVTPCKSPN